MQRSESHGAAGTQPVVIREFLHRHALSTETVAGMLGLELDTLRRYQEVGGAPAWIGFALIGLDYEQLGYLPDDGRGADPVRAPGRPMYPASLPVPAAVTADLAV